MDPRLRWLYTVVGVLGGLSLGIGIGGLRFGVTLRAVFWTTLGMVLLWWAFSARRKGAARPPEEPGGTHTVE
jgi:hypothetical protein